MDAPDKRFEPLTPPRNLTGELVLRLSQEILSGQFKPNEKLPTEQEMIATFGVSRTVVREAIAALRSEGLVESRQGAGVFVAGDMTRRPFRIDPHGLRTLKGVADVMELRMAVEIEAAGLAAERRSAEDVATIARALEAFEQAIREGDNAVDADYQFHHAVSQATGNDYFRSFIEFLGRHIIPRRSVHVDSQNPKAQKAYLTKVHKEHQAIHRAIEQADARAARRTMRRHLKQGRDRYLAFLDEGA